MASSNWVPPTEMPIITDGIPDAVLAALSAGYGDAASAGAAAAGTAATETPILNPIFPPIQPLPIPLPIFRLIRSGCYLMSYTPLNSFLTAYDGTLRVERTKLLSTKATGDLYQRGFRLIPSPIPPFPPIPIGPVEPPIPVPPIPGPNPPIPGPPGPLPDPPPPVIPTLPTLPFFPGFNLLGDAAAGSAAAAGATAPPKDMTNLFRWIPMPGLPPDPAKGIPILPINKYRYYVRNVRLSFLSRTGGFTMRFQLQKFDSTNNTWAVESDMTAIFTRAVAPAGFPSTDYYQGTVALDSAPDLQVGNMTLGWLSTYYRKASLEIDTMSGLEQPLSDGGVNTWRSAMDSVGWDFTVKVSDTNVQPPASHASGDDFWEESEMHDAMLASREAVDLNSDWRYHVLVVKRIRITERGIMYDAFGTDSNKVPREGACIATDWVMPKGWGDGVGQRFGAVPAAFFRATVHEIGHAMNQVHNIEGNFFMNTSDTIAARGETGGTPFPRNIDWGFHTTNLTYLRHYPDIFVRPGGVPFGSASATTPGTPDFAAGAGGDNSCCGGGGGGSGDGGAKSTVPLDTLGLLKFTVVAVQSEVPLGAPVRVDYTLTNVSNLPQLVPSKLSLKGQAVSGNVTDPSGTTRSFSAFVRCGDKSGEDVVLLQPGKSVSSSATLLRGGQGALFGTAGIHTVRVRAQWSLGSIGSGAGAAAKEAAALVEGSVSVMVTPPLNATHAKAAHKVLTTPDLHLVLVLGGDHLEEGLGALKVALACRELKPHYAFIEAKRLAVRFRARPANPAAANRFLESCGAEESFDGSEGVSTAAVMSTAEAAKRLTFK